MPHVPLYRKEDPMTTEKTTPDVDALVEESIQRALAQVRPLKDMMELAGRSAPDVSALRRPPSVVLAEAQTAAKALQDVIGQKKTVVMFNGEQYLEFEDWQTLGMFYGYTAKEEGDPEYVTFGDIRGFKASAVALNRDGDVRSRATAYCLTDEPHWRERPHYDYHMVLKNGDVVPEEQAPKDQWIWEAGTDGKSRPKKKKVFMGMEPVPLFQLASMAQTRANAKVLRNVLSCVAVLAGYRPTPAEEMTEETAAALVPHGSETPTRVFLPDTPYTGTLTAYTPAVNSPKGSGQKSKPHKLTVEVEGAPLEIGGFRLPRAWTPDGIRALMGHHVVVAYEQVGQYRNLKDLTLPAAALAAEPVEDPRA